MVERDNARVRQITIGQEVIQGPFFWSKCNFNGRIDQLLAQGLGAVDYSTSVARWIQDLG